MGSEQLRRLSESMPYGDRTEPVLAPADSVTLPITKHPNPPIYEIRALLENVRDHPHLGGASSVQVVPDDRPKITARAKGVRIRSAKTFDFEMKVQGQPVRMQPQEKGRDARIRIGARGVEIKQHDVVQGAVPLMWGHRHPRRDAATIDWMTRGR